MFKRIFTTIIITIMIIFILQPLNVFATGANANGTSENVGAGTKEVVNGPSASKQFWLLCITDGEGNVKSSVVLFKSNDIVVDYGYIMTRPEHDSIQPTVIATNPPFGWSFDSEGNGRGTEIKEWMKSVDTEGDGQPKSYTLIEQLWGVEMAEDWVANDWFLVLENGMWCNVYKDGVNTGKSFAGTAYGWGYFQDAMGIGEKGDPLINLYTNNIIANSTKLQYGQTRLSKPNSSGKILNTEMMDDGYGCLIVWSREVFSIQTTYDENMGDVPATSAKETTGITNIVKNYRIKKADGTYEDKGCFLRDKVSNLVTIEDEDSYSVVSWKTSDSTTYPIDSITWNVPGHINKQGTSVQSLNLNNNKEKTLYVLLEKTETAKVVEVDADYVVGESQLTRAISLDKNDKGEDVLNGHKFNWSYDTFESCGGHEVEEDCECKLLPGEKCTTDHTTTDYCTWTLNDSALVLNIKNDSFGSYPNNIAATSFWSDIVTEEISASRSGTGDGDVEGTFDYDCVIHRGNDSVTIAEWKNENEELDSLDNFNTANSKEANRKIETFTDTVNFNFVDNSSDLVTSATGSKSCTKSDTAALDEALSVDVDIEYKTYSGKKNTIINTDINAKDMLTIGSSGNNMVSGRMVESGLEFQFHPYIQMRYDTLDSKDNLVYVLGEYKRSIKTNDYAEIMWEKQTTANLKIESTQWSIHTQATIDKGVQNVLPGGATLTLSIPKSNRQIVTVRTYQTILTGEGREQVEITSGQSIEGYNEDTALEYHNEFVTSVAMGLDNLGLTQYVNRDDKADPFDGINAFKESNISDLDNGNSVSSEEDKYWFGFGTDENKSSEGDLDVNIGTTATQYYTFKSDVVGNITMNDIIILTKDQGTEYLSGVAKQINSRTYIVDKLVDALERNSGEDLGATWVSDGHWYNECMNGITIAVSSTKIETGIIEPGFREVIQDPKLNTKLVSTKYLFKDADKNPSYHVCAFKMNGYSDEYGGNNVIGLFKNEEVKMRDMDMLYYSRSYWISNITVQNLN